MTITGDDDFSSNGRKACVTPDQTEDVGLEEGADLLGGGVGGCGDLIAGPAWLDAGVVDEDIQPAVRLDLGKGRGNRDVVGHVDLDEAGAELVGGGPSALLVAGADVRPSARRR